MKSNMNMFITNISIPFLVGNVLKDLILLSHKTIYKELVLRQLDRSKANRDDSIKYNIEQGEWKIIYEIPFNTRVVNNVKDTQYKILHHFAATNELLYKMGKIPSPRCDICLLYMQTLNHLFFECLPIRSIWFNLQSFLREVTESEVVLDRKTVLFGLTENKSSKCIVSINSAILYAKHYIYMFVKCMKK